VGGPAFKRKICCPQKHFFPEYLDSLVLQAVSYAQLLNGALKERQTRKNLVIKGGFIGARYSGTHLQSQH
jgi:hypothetical protein